MTFYPDRKTRSRCMRLMNKLPSNRPAEILGLTADGIAHRGITCLTGASKTPRSWRRM